MTEKFSLEGLMAGILGVAGGMPGSGAAVLAGSGDVIEWDLSFPLVTSRFFLYDMAKLLFWTFLIFDGILVIILAFQGEAEGIPPFLRVSGMILLGFMLAILVIALIFFGNRYPTRYRIDPEGAYFISLSRRGAAANRLAFIAGLLAQKPGMAGAAMLASSRATGGVVWEDVHKIREYPAQRVITLMDSWHVIDRLYCTPENYSGVADLVRSYKAAGELRRKQAEQSVPKKSRAPKAALLSLVVPAACACVLASPFDVNPTLLGAAAVGALVAIWLPGLSRFAGGFTLGATAFVAVLTVRIGTEVLGLIPESVLKGAPMPAWAQYTRFGTMNPGNWFRFAICAVGLAVLAGLGLAAILGRMNGQREEGDS